MSGVLAIASTNLKRMLRDRSNIFFVFIFPLLLVFVLGIQFGGSFTPTVLLVAPSDPDAVGQRLVDALEANDLFDTSRVGDPADAADAVATGTADAAVVIPDRQDALLGDGVDVGLVVGSGQVGATIRAAVESVLASENATLRAARYARAELGQDEASALESARRLAGTAGGVEVAVESVGVASVGPDRSLGQFDQGASSQLLLFVFLTSLAGSSALIQTRQWGVSTRMLSTPTSARQILAGEALGRFAVALTQAVYIVVGTVVLFGVEWGDPLGAGAVLVAFSLVSAAAGMLLGALLDNDAQAGGLGVFLGLGLAALGGSMAPLEVLPPTMRTVAHVVTPHAWGNDAFADLVRRGEGLTGVLPEVGVLLAEGVVLLLIASVALRRAIVGRS